MARSLINGGDLEIGGRSDPALLRCSNVALLAIVERQSEYVAERHERMARKYRVARR
jgi:hypothetical protein